MLLKLKVEGRETKHGAGVVLVHDYTLHMVVYTFDQSGQGKANPKGRVTVSNLDTAAQNAKAFRGGHCGLEERLALDLILAMLAHAQYYALPLVWSKA